VELLNGILGTFIGGVLLLVAGWLWVRVQQWFREKPTWLLELDARGAWRLTNQKRHAILLPEYTIVDDQGQPVRFDELQIHVNENGWISANPVGFEDDIAAGGDGWIQGMNIGHGLLLRWIDKSRRTAEVRIVPGETRYEIRAKRLPRRFIGIVTRG